MGPLAALQHLLLELLASLASATGGSLGGAILLLTLGVRLALLPLNLAVARRARARRRLLEQLEPETRALQARLKDDPLALATALRELHRAKGVPGMGPLGIASLAVQAPLGAGLYAALQGGLGAGRRFLWIADLGRPDVALIGAVASLTGVAAALNPDLGASGRAVAIGIPMLLAAFTLSHLASGLALSWAASNAVGILQVGLLRREQRRASAQSFTSAATRR